MSVIEFLLAYSYIEKNLRLMAGNATHAANLLQIAHILINNGVLNKKLDHFFRLICDAKEKISSKQWRDHDLEPEVIDAITDVMAVIDSKKQVLF